MYQIILILSPIFALLGSLVVINLIIIFHELGHYYFARRCGLVSKAVCVGFGRLIYEIEDSKRTKWQLRFWPIGGYVDLFGNSQRQVNKFTRLRYTQKSLILLGGIIVNLLLAWLLLSICNLVGFEYRQTIIGKVYPNSQAAAVNMQKGDLIVQINGSPVKTWKDVAFPIIVSKSFNRSLSLVFQRDQKELPKKIVLPQDIIIKENEGILRSFGLSPAVENWPAIIAAVTPQSPAFKAKLVPGDQIISIDSAQLDGAHQLIDHIKDHPNSKIILTLRRDGNTYKKTVYSGSKGFFAQEGYLGIAFVPATKDPSLYGFIQYSVLESIIQALHESIQYLVIQAATIYLLASGTLSFQTIGGPVIILSQTFSLFSLQSIVSLIHWAAVVNISLAFINLLPIPVFDGGRLLLLSIEAITGSQLSNNTRAQIDRITFSLLLGLCAFITYNDIARLLGFLS